MKKGPRWELEMLTACLALLCLALILLVGLENARRLVPLVVLFVRWWLCA